MKHIVVLSTMYYPVMGAPSACIDKYVDELKNEYTFHIITKTDNLDFEPASDRDISYISSFRHRLLIKCRKQIKNNKNVIWNRIMILFVNFCKLIQTQYSIPSAQKWEVKKYEEELAKIDNKYGVDVAIAVSNNWVTQLAVMKYKKKHPGIKWVAFILDPYSQNYIYYKYKLFKYIWRKINYRIEQQVYNEVDYCMLSSELFKYIPQNFSISSSKFYRIQYVLTDICSKYLQNKQHNNHPKDICKLVFAGYFYKKIRNPEFMLSTLCKVKNIHLDMYVAEGECDTIISYYEKDNFKRMFFVNHDKYEELICNEYDVLVNVGNMSTLQAPSKMLELLSTGKPILNFYFCKDTQYDMIDKYPLGLNIGFQEENAVKKIEQFCHEMKGNSIPYEEVEKLYPENRLETQVKLLRRLIES